MIQQREFTNFLKKIIYSVFYLILTLTTLYTINSFIFFGKIVLSPILTEDPTSLRNAFAAASRVATLLLAMLISGMAIAIPLAANNFTPRLIKMFTKDKITRFIFVLLLGFGSFSMWLCFSSITTYHTFYVYTCFSLFLFSLSAIVPYLFHMFSFLNPNSLIFRLRINAQNKINVAICSCNNKVILSNLKHEIIEYMDSIANIALKALERNDRQSFSAAMLNIQILAIHYCKLKPYLPKEWHHLDVMEVGIFMGILTPARNEIQNQKVTLELHICQFLLEFFECVSNKTRDAADPVAFTIYKISTHYVYNNDKHGINMYVSLFNSALRLGINTATIRMVYNIASHYRNLAVDCMKNMPDVSINIAKKMLYYADLAIDRKGGRLDFVAEVMAAELRQMIEEALQRSNYKMVEKIMPLMFKIPYKYDNKMLMGVVKSRFALCGVLYRFKQTEFIEKLEKPMHSLNKRHIDRIYRDLLEENPLLYWEITPRQMNLDYVKIQDRNYLYDRIEELRKALQQ